MRYIVTKMILLGLVFFLGKVPALSQDTNVRCEIVGLDFNLSQADPGYLINFGSFSLFVDGKKEEDGVVTVVKFYKLPRTKLILSVGVVAYSKKDKILGNQLMTMMVLSKKRVPFSSESDFDKFFDNDKMTKNVIDTVQAIYSMKVFDGSEGITIAMPFLGKKKPIPIMMKCKKVKKAGS